MKTYIQHPPRKLQSKGYSSPIALTQYQRLQFVRDVLARNGFNLPTLSGN